MPPSSTWSHLIGGVRIPRTDVAFPHVALSRQPIVGTLPPRAYAVLGAPQFQSRANSCLPHALTALLEADVRARLAVNWNVSIQDLYFGARWLNGEESQDNGSYPDLGARWLKDYGSISAGLAPYDPNTVTTWRPDPLWVAQRRLLTSDVLPMTASVDQIKAELAAGRCAVVCHNVDAQMENEAATTGIEKGMTGSSLGGHARLVVGYDDADTIHGFPAGVFWIMNWWSGWGVKHPLQATDARFVRFTKSFSKISQSVLVSPSWQFFNQRLARGLAVEAA